MTDFLGFFVFVLIGGLFIRWLVIRSHFAALEDRLQRVERSRRKDLEEVIPDLVRRIYDLEKALRTMEARGVTPAPAASVPAPKPDPVPVEALPFEIKPPAAKPAVQPTARPASACELCGRLLPPNGSACECRSVRQQVPASVAELPMQLPPPVFPRPVAYQQPPAPVPPPPVPPRPLPPAPAAPRSSEEWEALVGGNLLLKLGMFIFVIGIALFLGYSFTMMGPAGRAAISLGVSLSLLIGGMILERRDHYQLFARGLIAGGWAATYVTVFAIHAVQSARVIDSPLVGGLLLFGVAAGMILHSLRYKSQSLTGLAYFAAFVSLNIIEGITTLSVVALIPLAASLLYIAYRFGWTEIAVFGILATYGSCALQKDTGAPAWQAQTIFTAYWLLFESFDLFEVQRKHKSVAQTLILPLNALFFAFLTWAKWGAQRDVLWLAAALVGGLYLTSAVIRWRLRPPSRTPDEPLITRIALGGYEGPVTLTAGLSALAVLLKLSGEWARIGLLIEAEVYFLAGLFLGQDFLKQLALPLFALGFAATDFTSTTRRRFAGLSLYVWNPASALTAVVFYVNRALSSADGYYGYLGSAVLTLVIGTEVPVEVLPISWYSFAAVLFLFGWIRRLVDFRFQAYAVATLALMAELVQHLDYVAGNKPLTPAAWIQVAVMAAMSYALAYCALRSPLDRLGDRERIAVRATASWATTGLLTFLVWYLVPEQSLGAGWLVLALVLFELGARGLPGEFVRQSYVPAAIGIARVLIFEVLPVRNDMPLVERWSVAVAALLAYVFASRVLKSQTDAIQSEEREFVFNWTSSAATLFVLTATWALLPGVMIAPVWAILSLLLLEVSYSLDLPGLRLQAHAVSASAFGRLFLLNFTSLGHWGLISHRLLTVTPILASEYFAWSRQRSGRLRWRTWEPLASRLYLYAAVVLAVLLLRFELQRVYAVAGWAVLSIALLVAGQKLRVPDLRWQSYAIAFITFFRSWTTNFFAPESFAGTTGRIGVGAFVIACLYAAQLLVPQEQEPGLPGEVPEPWERHARSYFSLLASVLLTVLLFHEVSGSVLTVAWGVEGIGLLLAGFPLRDRVLRLSGLALFLVCVLKLFFYDLRELETLYRILSFIVLGLLLVSVSWLYTRFRDRIQRYL